MAEKIIAVRVQISGLTEESKQIEQLNRELEKLSIERKKYNDLIRDGIGLSNQQKTDLAKIGQSTRDLNTEKTKLLKTEKDSAKEFKASKGSMEELRAKTAQLKDEVNKLDLTTQSGRKRLKELGDQIQNNNGKIRDFDRSLSGSSSLVGEYAIGIKAAFVAIGTAIAASYGAIKIFKAIIESTDITADEFERAIGGAKNALDYFMKSIATADFSNFFENMQKAIIAGVEYAKVMDEVRHRTIAETIAEADLELENAKLAILLRSKTTSNEEALKAGEKIKANDKEISELKTNIAKQELAAKIEKYDALGITEEIINQNLKNIEINADLIKKADQYNSLIKERTALGKIGVVGPYGSIAEMDIIAKRITEIYNELKTFDQITIDFAKGRSQYVKLTETELEDLRDSYIKVDQALQFEYGNNMRAQIKVNSLLAEREKIVEEGGKVSKKAIDDEIKATEKLIEIQRKAFNEYWGIKVTVEKSYKPISISGVIKQQLPEISKTIGFTGVGKDPYTAANEAYAASQEKIAKTADLASSAVIRLGDSMFDMTRSGKADMRGLMLALIDAVRGMIAAYLAESAAALVTKEVTKKGILGIVIGLAGMAALGAIYAGIENKMKNSTEKPQRLAHSGRITGGARIISDASGDDTLVVASQGEVILNRRHQSMLGGAATFKRIGVPGYAEGGIVNSQSLSYQPSQLVDVHLLAGLIVSGINNKQVQLVLSDLNEAQNTLSIIKQPSKF